MDAPSAAFDWNQARAFLATAERGSLSAAARALGLTQPTLGRQVSALERSLGVTLFERIGRGMELTRAGTELLRHVRDMEAAAGRMTLAATGQSQAISGEVRVTASDLYALHVLPPVLERLDALAPRIGLRIVASNALRDLTRREADIAVRHVRPVQPDLIARKVGEGAARIYAAPAYLDRRGRPRTPEALASHDFVGFAETAPFLQALQDAGLPVEAGAIRHASDSGVVMMELARRGCGLCMLPEEIAAADPGLELVLPDLAPFAYPVWLATHRELRTSRRIRLVFDLLADTLAARRG